MAKPEKLINLFYSLLFFLVPLVMWPYTSEVFEFNKLILVYILTVLITSSWAARMIIERKIIFRRTILDIPILAFLGSQILSTIFSVDFITSVFGYYSRFNGGLLSILAYCLLYWAYVTNVNRSLMKKHLIIIIVSSLLASLAAILEHFGIFLTCGIIGPVTTNCWQQEVQVRVFSTFGQPNWLAAWITAVSSITWFFLSKEEIKPKNYKFWLWALISGIFYLTLLFTRSRSGLAGYGVAFLIFWGYLIYRNKSKIIGFLGKLIPFGILILIPTLLFGTPWTPRIDEVLTHKITSTNESAQGPALEVGGTESGTIRKIVWKGAVDVWLHYPILGSGVETFAYSYYQYRPEEHNLVSEWDYIYNKAHNEYLNYAATTGTLGILAYLFLIGASILIFRLEISDFRFALIAGYVSILISNFFGFSVVPIEILFFLFPAFAIVPATSEEVKAKSEKVSTNQKIFIIALLVLTFYFLLLISKYWRADVFYARGKGYDSINKPDLAASSLQEAINLTPFQALYHSEISQSYALLAVDASNKKDTTNTKNFTEKALVESQKSLDLSPANLNIRRLRFGVFIRLSVLDPQFLVLARDTLSEAIKYAPTDAKLFYNLGLTQARTGQIAESARTFEKAIELKPDYREARLAYAVLLVNQAATFCNLKNTGVILPRYQICQNGLENYNKAQDQLLYILNHIDPKDALAQQTLQEIK